MAKLSPTDAATLASKVLAGGSAELDGHTLERADVEVELVAKDGFAAAGDRAGVIVLDTKLDDELKDLGMVRELQSRVQGARKEMELGYADRIHLFIVADGKLRDVADKYAKGLASEVLADGVIFGTPPSDAHVVEATVEGMSIMLGIKRA
jgi:isoleucyl-tRNA synthetase